MLKKEAVRRILNEQVADVLNEKLSQHKFRYSKQKQNFYRKKGEFKHNITFYNPTIIIDRENVTFYLKFHISSFIEIPKFDKWLLNTSQKNSHFTFGLKRLTVLKIIEPDIFDKNEFYTPTANQIFKSNVIASLTTENNEELIDFEILNNNIEKDFVVPFDDYLNIENILEKKKDPYLMYYAGFKENAKEKFKEMFDHYVDEINNKVENYENYYRYLNEHINTVYKISKLKLKNPFDTDLKLSDSQNEVLIINDKFKYKENLRFKFDKNDRIFYHTNLKGDIVFVKNNKTIYKYNNEGILQKTFNIEKENHFWDDYGKKLGVIKGTNDFYIDNYILKDDNSILILSLNEVITDYKPKSTNPNINDIAFVENIQNYIIAYVPNRKDRYLLFYNRKGKLLKNVKLKYYPKKIISEKKWIITQNNKDIANIICDFNGNEIHNLKYGDGNDRIILSNSYQYFLSFGHKIKSELYNLKKQKKSTLWAHPTYIKGYKEKLYNGEMQSYYLSYAKFSPDEKYIIGSGFHGKYVAWELPKVNRIELIPEENSLQKLAYTTKKLNRSTELENSKIYSETFVPKIEIIEGKKFLKNRANMISNIYFFENGNYFLTEINKKYLLLWNRNFENIAFVKNEGSINIINDDTLFIRKENEIIQFIRTYKKTFNKHPKKVEKFKKKKIEENGVNDENKKLYIQKKNSKVETKEDVKNINTADNKEKYVASKVGNKKAVKISKNTKKENGIVAKLKRWLKK